MRVYSDSTSGGGLLDCVIIDISIPGFGCVDFYFVIGGGSFTLGFFVGLAYLPVFLVWDVGGFFRP